MFGKKNSRILPPRYSDPDFEFSLMVSGIVLGEKRLAEKFYSFQVTENGKVFNQSEEISEKLSDAPARDPKRSGGVKGWDTCAIPCDVTVKLLQDEKHSICGKTRFSWWSCYHWVFVQCMCLCACVCLCVQPSYSNLCWCLAAAPGSLLGM